MSDLSFPHRHTPRRPWAPMSDLEWHALMPFVLRRSGPGRPLREIRQRLDAMFWVAARHAKWREVPERFGEWGTVARHFWRLTHRGLWQRLLEELAVLGPEHPLRGLEHFICRAARRAYRLIGLGLIVLARKLGLRAALPGPPWLLPHPDLSQSLADVELPLGNLRLIRGLRWLWGFAAGRQRIPGSVVRARA